MGKDVLIMSSTVARDSSSLPSIVMEGYLRKKGTVMFFSNWTKRRFVLDSANVLSYYDDSTTASASLGMETSSSTNEDGNGGKDSSSSAQQRQQPRGSMKLIIGRTKVNVIKVMEADGRPFCFMLRDLEVLTGTGAESVLLSADSKIEENSWLIAFKQVLSLAAT